MLLLLLALQALAVSCSFAEPEGAAAGRPADFPDMSLTNAVYVLGQQGANPIRINGSLIEFYQKADTAYLTDITFSQLGKDGTVILSGKADSAIINTKTQDASITGNVELHKVDDSMLIRCEAMTWTDAQQLIQSVGDGLVTVSYGDGNTLTGQGYSGDLANATHEFAQVLSGRILP